MLDYSKIISDTVQDIKPSGIRKFFDLLDGRRDVISLTVGQPDFITPWHIRVAAIESLEKRKDLLHVKRRNNGAAYGNLRLYAPQIRACSYDPKDEIIVTVGGSEAIDLCIRTLVNPGDEVIIPQPSFVCYGPITSLAGGVPVYVETKEEDNFKLTPEELKNAITPKTKLLVLPFPNNPTGAIMTREDLEKIAEVLRGTDIMVLSDEIYCELTYGREHVSIASLDGMRERCVVASGFSKTYAMTGWRLGYTLAPREVTKQMLKVHQYAIMCAPTSSQYAAVEAMRNGDPDVDMMRSEYNRRRRYIVAGLRGIGFECFDPEGAFYAYPNVSRYGLSSEDFARRLLDEAGVAVVPGTAFGDCGEGFVRISYAYSVEHIAKALDRIEKFVNNL